MSFLEKILACKREEIAAAKNLRPPAAVEKQASQRRDFRSLAAALRPPGVRIIAEIKRASPSKGDLRPELCPEEWARAYLEGGAAALSVLTEPAFFKGSAADLSRARAAVDLPVLRKDFILEPYQVYESVVMGADAILLIVRILDDEELQGLHELALNVGLEPLVEIYDEVDAVRLTRFSAPLVAINNRDLSRFHTDPERAGRLVSSLPAGTMAVAASAIHGEQDIRRALSAGLRRFLIGEALLKSDNPTALLSSWISLPVQPELF